MELFKTVEETHYRFLGLMELKSSDPPKNDFINRFLKIFILIVLISTFSIIFGYVLFKAESIQMAMEPLIDSIGCTAQVIFYCIFLLEVTTLRELFNNLRKIIQMREYQRLCSNKLEQSPRFMVFTGCKNPSLNRMYTEIHQNFEKRSQAISSFFLKIFLPSFIIPDLPRSFYKYYISGHSRDSFQLLAPVLYVKYQYHYLLGHLTNKLLFTLFQIAIRLENSKRIFDRIHCSGHSNLLLRSNI